MQIKGKKRLVRKAACFAKALGVFQFSLTIIESDEPASYCQRMEDGSFVIAMSPNAGKYWETRYLAHEMVHLRQYKHDDLRTFPDHFEWKGERFFEPEFLSDDYFLAPWEMEARALEAWLVHKWETREDERLH
jgi:hypothetical protein